MIRTNTRSQDFRHEALSRSLYLQAQIKKSLDEEEVAEGWAAEPDAAARWEAEAEAR